MKTTWFYPTVWLAFTMGFTCFEIICCDDFSAESSAFPWDKFVEWLFGHHGVRRSIGGSIPGTKLVGLPRLAVDTQTQKPSTKTLPKHTADSSLWGKWWILKLPPFSFRPYSLDTWLKSTIGCWCFHSRIFDPWSKMILDMFLKWWEEIWECHSLQV